MRILLTGGTGFFGKSILRHWISSENIYKKSQLVVLSRNPGDFLKSNNEFDGARNLSWVKGDIMDFDSLPIAEEFSHIIHAAADSTLGPKLDQEFRYSQIVDGTRNLLKLSAVTKVKRFLYVSSGAVYGKQPENSIQMDESYCGGLDPLDPSSTYGLAKKTAEHLSIIMAKKYGFETSIARCFAFVGPDLPRDVHFAIGNFIEDAVKCRNITIKGDGAAIRSYMDQRDLAFWLLKILVKGQDGHAYNVGSNISLSILEVAEMVKLVINQSLNIIVEGAASAGAVNYVPNIDKSVGELGLSLKYSLKDAINFSI